MGSPGVGVRTLRARRGPGSRVAPLSPPTPRPFPPVPGLPLPLRKLALFPAGPPLPRGAQSRGLREGGGEAAAKGDDPFRGGVEFQLPTLGPHGTPQPGPACPHLLPGDRAADRPAGGLLCTLGGARLCPPRPRSPPPPPASPTPLPASLSLAPHLSVPREGTRLLPARWGPGGFTALTLQGGGRGGRAGEVHPGPGLESGVLDKDPGP